MIADRAQLEAMKMPELKAVMHNMGGSSGPQETKAELIDRILLAAAQQPVAEKKKQDDNDPTVKKVPHNTIEDVKKAVGKYILLGMKVYLDKDSDSWLFRVRLKDGMVKDTRTNQYTSFERWGEDSGTLNQPLSVIVKCASVLMQRLPKSDAARKKFNAEQKYDEIA
jgi:hypothetical protein